MHRRIRSLILVAFFASFAVAHAQSTAEASLPLPENYFPQLKTIIDHALKQSPRMIARNSEDLIAEQNRIIARSGQLPTAGGYFSYYPWDKQTRLVTGLSTHGERMSYSASINQPLFHWGALRENTKMGQLNQKIAQGQTAEAYRILVNEIRSSYLLLIIKKNSLDRARFQQGVAENDLSVAKSKREKNVISEADMFGPTINAEQARLWTDKVQDDYDLALVAFGKLTGLPALSDNDIPNTVPAVTPVTDTVNQVVADISTSNADSYGLRTLRKQLELERMNYKITRTRLLPKANLVGGISQDQQRITYNQEAPYEIRDVFIGTTVSWTLFDGFMTRAAKRASLLRQRQLETNYSDAQIDYVNAVREQKKQIDFATRNLAIQEKLLESAVSGLKDNEEDQKRGVRSEQEVNAARIYLYNTRINAYQARNEYLTRVAELLSSVLKDPALANLPAQYR